MKYFIALITLSLNLSAHAFVTAGSNHGTAPAQDYKSCIWNVWVMDPTNTSTANLKNFISRYATVQNIERTETGAVVIEAKFRSEPYASPEEASLAAKKVVETLNHARGVSAVCQGSAANRHPRLSGGT
jgi:hypothetical protein